MRMNIAKELYCKWSDDDDYLIKDNHKVQSAMPIESIYCFGGKWPTGIGFAVIYFIYPNWEGTLD